MKRAPRSRQRHDLYAKYHDYDSEISDLLGECGLRASGGGVPQGMRVETMILYSYSHCNEPLETRWVEDGIPDFFYTNEEAARQAILSLREEVGEAEWTPMRIERIEIEPMTDENVLILLNDGIAAILTAYEIVETVS